MLRDYQTQGATWICEQLQHHRAVMLCDEMGLGKTLQALRAAQDMSANRVLIICPAGARAVWRAEIIRWFPAWADRVVLIEPRAPAWKTPNNKTTTAQILIVGYDELSNLKSTLVTELRRRHRWDLLVLDEAHYLRNSSNRTQAIYGYGTNKGLQASADKVLLLTGTPTPNHAGELWQHVRTFWPELIGHHGRTQATFEDRFTNYRDTVYGRQVTGSKNQAVLRGMLSPVILRRRKADVLAELPPLILQDIPLDRVFSSEWFTGIRPEARATAARLSYAAQHATDDELLHELHKLDNGGALATVRRELGLLKVKPTIAWVQEQMLSSDKIVLFAWHHEVINGLERGLLEFDPVVITGHSSPNARALAVEDFQTSPGTRVFIGQILAAGTAITLTAASAVAIVEPSWVPGENAQAIARAHRLGQRDSVLASFLYLPGTLDQRIMQVFRRKANEISVLTGDRDDASQHERQHGIRSGDGRGAAGVSADADLVAGEG